MPDTNPLFDSIRHEIRNNDIVLFMKGSPSAPMCGFSATVCSILKNLKVGFKGIDILKDQELRNAVKSFSDWPTLPQLYIKGEFIGGCDIAREMYENGELQALLTAKNIQPHA
jgi:monothiol glutaredoxin